MATVTRRDFLKGLGLAGTGGVLAIACGPGRDTEPSGATSTHHHDAEAQTAGQFGPEAHAALQPPVLPGTTLRIPPLLSPPARNGILAFELNLQRGQLAVGEDRTVDTFGINGPHLGPTLRAARGDNLIFAVANQLGEPTTLHWHGMHVPAVMDGGPHQEIAPGSVWRPGYRVAQEAATLWYHPHGLGRTRPQVQRGMVGMFILDDANPVHAALPRTYGVDDVPLILQDSLIGPGIVVNGSVAPSLVADRARLRFRLLNATDRQFINLGFGDGREFEQIASDGGLLPSPARLTRLTLGPAERAEIIVERGDAPSSEDLVLQRFGGGGAGNGATLLTINGEVRPQTLPKVPSVLNRMARLDPTSAAVTRQLVLGGGSTINGQRMSTMEDMMNMETAFRVRLGDVEQWDVRNASRATHVLHIHDVQFQILSRNGGSPPAGESGWKDTVLMRPGDQASLIMHFADYADANHPYMYHCHVLDHEDEGMMGHFVVVPT